MYSTIFVNAVCGSGEEIDASVASRSIARASSLISSDFNLSASDTFGSFVIASLLSMTNFNKQAQLDSMIMNKEKLPT